MSDAVRVSGMPGEDTRLGGSERKDLKTHGTARSTFFFFSSLCPISPTDVMRRSPDRCYRQSKAVTA